jgi:hypothetical protein
MPNTPQASSAILIEVCGIHSLPLYPAEAFVFGDGSDLDRSSDRFGKEYGKPDEADRGLDQETRQVDRVLNWHGGNGKRRVQVLGQVRLQFYGALRCNAVPYQSFIDLQTESQNQAVSRLRKKAGSTPLAAYAERR